MLSLPWNWAGGTPPHLSNTYIYSPVLLIDSHRIIIVLAAREDLHHNWLKLNGEPTGLATRHKLCFRWNVKSRNQGLWFHFAQDCTTMMIKTPMHVFNSWEACISRKLKQTVAQTLLPEHWLEADWIHYNVCLVWSAHCNGNTEVTCERSSWSSIEMQKGSSYAC